MIPADPTCPHCRYDLTGIAAEQGPTVCPECGGTFDPGNPFGLRPWPRPVVIGLVMAAPCAAAFLFVLSVHSAGWDAAFSAIEPLEHIADGATRWSLLAAWLVWPGVVAHRVAGRCAHPGERTMVWTVLTLSGIGLNALVILGLAFLSLVG